MRIAPGLQPRFVVVAATRRRTGPVGVGERERLADADVVFASRSGRDTDDPATARCSARGRQLEAPVHDLARRHASRSAGGRGDHPHAPVAEVEEAALEGAHRASRRGTAADPRRADVGPRSRSSPGCRRVDDPQVGGRDVVVGVARRSRRSRSSRAPADRDAAEDRERAGGGERERAQCGRRAAASSATEQHVEPVEARRQRFGQPQDPGERQPGTASTVASASSPHADDRARGGERRAARVASASSRARRRAAAAGAARARARRRAALLGVDGVERAPAAQVEQRHERGREAARASRPPSASAIGHVADDGARPERERAREVVRRLRGRRRATARLPTTSPTSDATRPSAERLEAEHAARSPRA